MLNKEDYQHIFHEIKNTVALINSSLQLIQKQHPEVTGFNYWDDTLSDVQNLRSIITELSTAKLAKDPECTPVKVLDFMDQIKNSTYASFEKSSVLCTFSTDPELPDIFIDSLRMKEAIINLLKNSYEAVGASGSVLVHAYLNENNVCIDISDSGCGMDADTLNRLYTPFFTSKENGNGLGLVITKNIIEAHNGSLSCHSIPQKGTTFTITLPAFSVSS